MSIEDGSGERLPFGAATELLRLPHGLLRILQAITAVTAELN